MIEIELNNTQKNTVKLYEFDKDKIILPPMIDCEGKYKTIKKTSGYKRFEILSEPMFFDSETSHNHDEDNPKAWIYQWCVCIFNKYIGGRTPTQFINLLKKIVRTYQLNENRKMIIYIHNLSYDITYLMDFLREYYEVELLALKPHKILTFTCNKTIEFRCSYLLSNRSLEKWCDYTNSEIKKAVGAIDYDKILYQDSELGYNDWFYQVNDVASMKNCYENMLEMFEDNITTIPLTNTGYIRRDMRREARKDKNNRKHFLKCKMTPKVYIMLTNEFSGGYTHGNRYKVGQNVYGDIRHFDFKSHYPSSQMLDYYPMSAFILYDNRITFSQLNKLCEKYCVLAKITFKNLHIKENITIPYISRHKCEMGKIGRVQFLNEYRANGDDNGRVIEMIGICTLYLNELDMKWIIKQYKWDGIIIEDVHIANRGDLPPYFKTVINNYFKIKETTKDKTQRDKSKNNLNAGYGMTATNPIRSEVTIDFDTGQWQESRNFEFEYIEKKLEEFYKSRNNIMIYAWGCWCTSHARDKLLTTIEYIGMKNFLYCDTDSVFFLYSQSAINGINQFNKEIIEVNKIKNYGVINSNNEFSYYGTFEDEKDNIKIFRFLHSKCYAFVDSDNKLHCTIAGVSKQDKVSGITSAEELQTIDNLRDGFIFTKCGGTCSTYVTDIPHVEKIDNHITELASACIIKPIEKHLNELHYLNPDKNYRYLE